MPRPTKKSRLVYASGETIPTRRSRRIASRLEARPFDDLGIDLVAMIFEFLGPTDIMRSRVCRKMRLAARVAIVPIDDDFRVQTFQKFDALTAMATALPNLQRIFIRDSYAAFILRLNFDDGEDPDEEFTIRRRADSTIDWPTHNVNIITSFRKLRQLEMFRLPLNGRHPTLFHLPLLQKLTIDNCNCLKWDLSMLEGTPLLRELRCARLRYMCGSMNSLRILKDTLETVKIYHCDDVKGDFMDLADFPHLKELELPGTSVTGDVRKIGEEHFLEMKHFDLPDTVIGGNEYEFHRISDVPEMMHSIHRLRKRFSHFAGGYMWSLSSQSPDYYHFDHPHDSDALAPFFILLIQVGSRLGWRWVNDGIDHYCEANWLDVEPDRESSDYEAYMQEMQFFPECDIYRGFHQPPTEEEYARICTNLHVP